MDPARRDNSITECGVVLDNESLMWGNDESRFLLDTLHRLDLLRVHIE